jgi:DNA-binding response OmpR family regulator
VPKTLLAVDDSTTMRKVLEITFSSDDFRVLGAENSRNALAQLAEEPVAALIDTSLEGDDGYALAKQIRARDPKIAIILMASRYNPYDANRGRDAGADDYADKPFDTQGLIDKVKKAIAAREAAVKAAPVAAPPAAAPVPAGSPFGGTPRPAVTATVPSRGPVPVGPRAHTLSFDSGPLVPAQGGGPAPGPTTSPTAPSLQRPPASTATQKLPSHVQQAASLGPVPAVKPTAGPSPHTAPTAAPPATTQPTTVAAPPHAAEPAPAAPAAPALASAAAIANGHLAGKLDGLGLTPQQAEAVLSLSRELVERVVWEVVPPLAELLIKEEIARLTKQG